MVHRLTPSPCPQCGKVLDSGQDSMGDDAPQLGDISVCFGCGALLCYGLGMVLENFPEDELTPDLLAHVQFMRAAMTIVKIQFPEG